MECALLNSVGCGGFGYVIDREMWMVVWNRAEINASLSIFFPPSPSHALWEIRFRASTRRLTMCLQLDKKTITNTVD